MTKVYLKVFVTIIFVLWVIYFMQTYLFVEGFTPKINSMYRPYVRNINIKYENFVSNYGPDVIVNKLRKLNIY
jgi:hypothetical protein